MLNSLLPFLLPVFLTQAFLKDQYGGDILAASEALEMLSCLMEYTTEVKS